MRWISNSYETLFDQLSHKEYIELCPGESRDTYFLIHGFASSVLDLMPIAQELYEKGNRVILITLDGHRGAYQPEEMTLEKWLRTCERVISELKEEEHKSYLVGFSIGALLALKLSTIFKFNGVTCISTFTGLKPGSSQEFLLNVLEAIRFKQIRRFLQVSDKSTKSQLAYFDKLSVDVVNRLNKDIENLLADLGTLTTNILLLHTYNDLVSDYRQLCNICNQHIVDFEIVTFRGLKHFLQFDIPPKRLVEYMDTYFSNLVADKRKQEDEDLQIIQMLHEESNREIAQNVSNNFNLIIGFFSVFGAFIYFTLPIVSSNYPNQDPSSPYYILAYSLMINFYILIVSTYVFYMNRAIAYTRNHIEPYYSVIGINEYKQNEYMSGKESTNTTKIFSAITTILPLFTSFGALMYNLIYYSHRFLVISWENVLLQLSMVTVISTFIFVIFNLIRVLKHTNREIYGIHLNRKRSRTGDILLSKLYYAVNKGGIKQNKSFISMVEQKLSADTERIESCQLNT